MTGFFGKIPTADDFVSWNLPKVFIDRWDRWMSMESGGSGGSGLLTEARSAKVGGLSGAAALDAFLGIAAMNIALFASLSDADRAIALAHPEYGSLTVDWIIHQMAGHQIHHLKQLEAIATR